jgi:hypothetical protein
LTFARQRALRRVMRATMNIQLLSVIAPGKNELAAGPHVL